MNVKDLELSVRTSNLLAQHGINEVRDLMLLDRDTVISWKSSGRRTWQEIEETQEILEQSYSERTFALLNRLADQWNYHLDELNEDPRKASRYMFTMDSAGRVACWKRS